MIDGFTRVLQTASDLRVLLGLVPGARLALSHAYIHFAGLFSFSAAHGSRARTHDAPRVEGRRRLVQHEQIRSATSAMAKTDALGLAASRASSSPDRRVLRCR